jgi:3-deoxy-7-phosphoheptulonate synthase
MHQPTSDLRIRATRPLPAPATCFRGGVPPGRRRLALARGRAREIAAIMSGADDRLLVVVGPCSIHDPGAAVEYAGPPARRRGPHAGELVVAMRVYFEKPRTVVGWKGLINDPDLDGTFHISKGLRIASKLMVDITAAGLPIATEFLDTTLGQYYADLVSWGAIGARTVESQVHRELASGLSMPVGFKNRTDGDVQVAVDAIRSARHPHWFPSLARGRDARLHADDGQRGHPPRAPRGLERARTTRPRTSGAAVELLAARAGFPPPHGRLQPREQRKDAERQSSGRRRARVADRGATARSPRS